MSLPTHTVSTTVILGLPGAGKTRLALELAAHLAGLNVPVFVLHTDILKVTARALDPSTPRGPAYGEDARRRCERARLLLEAHENKAMADGYALIVEGTLAATFHPERGRRYLLELPEDERLGRVDLKHAAARRALEHRELAAYRELLNEERVDDDVSLDARVSPRVLVTELLRSGKG